MVEIIVGGKTYALTDAGVAKLRKIVNLRNFALLLSKNTKVVPDGRELGCTCGSKVGHTEDCRATLTSFMVSCSIRAYLTVEDIQENS